MERDIYDKLKQWKISNNRKPLLLEGARQVGKTYVLKKFGLQEFSEMLYLNFEQDNVLKNFFSKSLDPHEILKNLSIHFERNVDPKETLIIFDEIQECPAALNSFKYFAEQAPEYYMVGAGSLLGVTLAHTQGFPVGKVNILHLYPLNFLEFLSALNQEKLHGFITGLEKFQEIPEPIHQKLIDFLKLYLFIGGMPEVVHHYLENKNLLNVRETQRELVTTYERDFSKHVPSGAQIMRIMQVWDAIPQYLSEENRKFTFSMIKKGARAREYDIAIQWLDKAGLIYRSYSISTAKVPLKSYQIEEVFKVFFLDVGLIGALCKLPLSALSEGSKLFTEFKGSLTENFVAQELKSYHYDLYYWSSEGQAEVDFILENDGDVYPLEVKSGTSTKKKSLQVYDKKFNPTLLLRATLMNYRKDGKVCNVPLYLLNHLGTILLKHQSD